MTWTTASGRLLPLRCQTNDGARLPFVGIRQRACFSKMHRVRAEHGASDAGGTQIKIGGWGYGGVLDWANLKSLPRLKQFDPRPGLSEWTTISHHGLECGSRSKNR